MFFYIEIYIHTYVRMCALYVYFNVWMHACKCRFICCALARFACSRRYFSCLHCWRFSLHVQLGWGIAGGEGDGAGGTLYIGLLTVFFYIFFFRGAYIMNAVYFYTKMEMEQQKRLQLIAYNPNKKKTLEQLSSHTLTHTQAIVMLEKSIHMWACVCVCVWAPG